MVSRVTYKTGAHKLSAMLNLQFGNSFFPMCSISSDSCIYRFLFWKRPWETALPVWFICKYVTIFPLFQRHIFFSLGSFFRAPFWNISILNLQTDQRNLVPPYIDSLVLLISDDSLGEVSFLQKWIILTTRSPIPLKLSLGSVGLNHLILRFEWSC